jgi:anti-sigma regulatory factor (Ser/Thr protein kinase)
MVGSGRKAFFKPRPQSAGEVRAFVRDVCAAWGVPADAPILMVDELATNAITHARTAFWVSACRQPGGLRVEVGDESPRAAVLGDPVAQAESGRGLQIVAALARRWGTDRDEDGKTVWFEV